MSEVTGSLPRRDEESLAYRASWVTGRTRFSLRSVCGAFDPWVFSFGSCTFCPFPRWLMWKSWSIILSSACEHATGLRLHTPKSHFVPELTRQQRQNERRLSRCPGEASCPRERSRVDLTSGTATEFLAALFMNTLVVAFIPERPQLLVRWVNKGQNVFSGCETFGYLTRRSVKPRLLS